MPKKTNGQFHCCSFFFRFDFPFCFRYFVSWVFSFEQLHFDAPFCLNRFFQNQKSLELTIEEKNMVTLKKSVM